MSDKSHSINLTRMWQVQGDDSLAQGDDSIGSAGKPVEDDSVGSNRWLDLASFSTREIERPIRLIRNFNCPTGLNADSRCELVLGNLPVGTICHLNGQPLGLINGESCRFEISQYLCATNRILIELDSATGSVTAKAWSVRLAIA